MENQHSRHEFREKVITHFYTASPKYDNGEVQKLFSEMTYREKKEYIHKLERLAGELPDDMYLLEMIHLGRSQLLAILGPNTVNSILTVVLALWIVVVYSRRPIAPYLSIRKKEEIHLVK